LDTAEWRYTVTKTSTPHIVPLSRQAVEILRELHPLTGRGRFVFPGARSNGRPMSDNAILAAMRRMALVMMYRTKAELIEMFEQNGDVMVDLVENMGMRRRVSR
jgi:integrase